MGARHSIDNKKPLMNLRPKIIALIAAVFVLLGAAQYLIQEQILLPSFAELERQSASNEMARAIHAVDRELDQLTMVAADWGDWAETYAFMANHDQQLIEESIPTSEIVTYGIDAVAFVDLSGRFLWSRTPASGRGDAADLDLIRAGALPDQTVWRDALRNGTTVRGLVRTNRGLMLVVGNPVLDGHAHGPSRGMALLGRLLTPARIATISEQAQTALTLSAERIPAAATRVGDESLLVRDQVTEVYRVLNDVSGQPLTTLRVAAPRLISARGRQVVTYADAFLGLAAAAVVLLLIVALNLSVLKPIARLTRHAVEIGKGLDTSARLDLQRTDELGQLATEIDRMVGNLAEARRQLVDQSFLAGVAENARAVLHNIGNAMTPLCVKVAVLRDALRGAPATEITVALDELDRASADMIRVASLERYVHLASRELAVAVTAARTEIERIAEQSQAIRSLLGEQTRNLRAPAPLETCTLPELLAQGTALVPPALRRLLAVEIDPAAVDPGTLRIARTIMQQVIQNIVINAAEAVRDAGREHGVLRVSWERVSTGGERLRLCFTDDGVGIPAENLGRIFQNGFSTKLAQGNSGVGLHWCGNAVHALGGRIHAESPGPGRGTRICVEVPLNAADSAGDRRVA
jgi:sensor domain CHASE-containing protein